MTLAAYHNFDLLLTRAGARYKAIVVDAPAGEESVLFDPPFAADALPRLEGLARGATRNMGAADDPGATTSLTDLGSQLFAAVFGGPLGNLLAASLASVAAEGAGLRLRLRVEADAAELALLPWETLYDPAQGHFVGLGEASPILRYLALPRSRSALPVKPPLRVLALLASPAGLPPLDVEQEWQTIQTALAGLVADGKFVLERLASPTLDALQARLLGEPVHILHFIGHGRFDETNQTGGLAFADAHNRPHLAPGGDLAKLLRNHPAVRLAYLNACEGALASGQSVFTGVAQALVREGVPAAVAMQAEISDPGAIELARTFYTALAAGRPVDAALTQARVALSATGSGEWAIPVLFSRSPDNRLFDIRQVLPTPDCPYPGMVPFSEAQKDLFFGREREIEEATARLRQHPFLAVIGPSGSGKSSLIYAGLIPALRKSRRGGAGEWQIKTMRPSDRRTPDGRAAPMQALAELLGLTPQTPGDQPANPPVSPSPNPSTPTLLFVDQFEELFTLAAPDEAQAFLDALASLMGRPNLSILLTARADFYPELMACSLWPSIKANRLELPPLGDDELWAAIVEPANRVGVTVDEALAVRLIADASGQKGVLPLVQETLVLLWDRVEERQLRLKAYQALARDGRSGLQVAIDRRASLVYDNLPAAAQPMARRIFLRLVQFGEGRADTRRQQTAAELRASGDDPALFDQTLARLIESRLLTASGDAEGGARRVDIAHEALIAGWPRLQEWLGQRRAAEGTRRRLEGKAAEWVAAQKRGGLLDEYELQEAEHWLASEDAGELGYSQDLADLVNASKDAIAQAAAERDAQQRRELEHTKKLAEEQRLRAEEGERAARRLRKRLIAATVAVAIAVIAFAAAAWFGVDAGKQRDNVEIALATATAAQGQAEIEASNARAAKATADANAAVAERQSRIALARQIATQSRLERGDTGLLLALKATLVTDPVTQKPLAETEEALRATLSQWSHWQRNIGTLEAKTRALDFFDDDRFLISAAQDGRVLKWPVDGSGTPMLLMKAAAGTEVYSVAVDQQRARLAIGTANGEIHLIDVRDAPQETVSWQAHAEPNPVLSLAFSPDGEILASGGGDNMMKTWRLDALDQPAATVPAPDWVRTVAISSDGQWLALGGDDRTGSLWRLEESGHPTQVLTDTFQARVNAVAFNSDNSILAIGSQDGTVHQVDLDQLTTAPIILKHPSIASGVLTLAFSAHPAQLLVGTSGGDLVEVDLSQLPPNWTQLARLDTPIKKIAISASGQMIASGGDKGAIRIWSREPDFAEPRVLEGHRGWLRALVFGGAQSEDTASPEDRGFVSASEDGSIVIRSSDGQSQQVLQAPGGALLSADVSRDGRWLAVGGTDGAVRVWALDELAAQPTELQGHQSEVVSVRFSPVGDVLATAGTDRRVLLWDLADMEAAPIALQGSQQGVLTVAFSPDGKLLAAGDQLGGVYLWELQRIQNGAKQIGQHDDWIRSVNFSPDSNLLVTAGDDGAMKVISVGDGETQTQNLSAHQGRVRWATFSPDGKTIATAGDDMTVKLWNSADLTEKPVVLRGHRSIVRALAFSPDGRWLVSGGDDRLIYMWTVHLGDLQEMVCARVAADLSEETWISFFGSEPYGLLCNKEASQ